MAAFLSEEGVSLFGEEIDAEMERGTSLADRKGRSKRVTGDTGPERFKEDKLVFVETTKLRASIVEDHQIQSRKKEETQNFIFWSNMQSERGHVVSPNVAGKRRRC